MMSNTPQRKLSSDPIVIPEPTRSRAPDGSYKARLIDYMTTDGRYGPKVEMIFRVDDPANPIHGKEFSLFFAVEKVLKPFGFNGKFIPKGYNSKLVRLLNHCKEILGVDEDLSAEMLSKTSWLITLRSPSHDSDKRLIPERSRYSIIQEAIPTPKENLTDW
jgi:hypothetical protein